MHISGLKHKEILVIIEFVMNNHKILLHALITMGNHHIESVIVHTPVKAFVKHTC